MAQSSDCFRLKSPHAYIFYLKRILISVWSFSHQNQVTLSKQNLQSAALVSMLQTLKIKYKKTCWTKVAFDLKYQNKKFMVLYLDVRKKLSFFVEVKFSNVFRSKDAECNLSMEIAFSVKLTISSKSRQTRFLKKQVAISL